MAKVIGFRPANLPAFLSRGQVVNWIAFRTPADRRAEAEAALLAKWGDGQLDHPEGYGVLRALRAMNGGAPLYAPEKSYPDDWPDWMRQGRPLEFARLEEAVAAMVEARGVPIAELIVELDTEISLLRQKNALQREATLDLIEAEGDRLISSSTEKEHYGLFHRNDVMTVWLWEPPTARRRRENLRHDWSGVSRLILARLDQDGMPNWERQRGAKADWERWIASLFPADEQPAASQVREALNKAIASHRAKIG